MHACMDSWLLEFNEMENKFNRNGWSNLILHMTVDDDSHYYPLVTVTTSCASTFTIRSMIEALI